VSYFQDTRPVNMTRSKRVSDTCPTIWCPTHRIRDVSGDLGDKLSTKITWVRECIVSSEIVKSNSWRQVGGIKSCQFILCGKFSIHFKMGS
jgi:hypothetical protein